MKCFVLAGGSSDRLWPLSRKDFPKQFMELREGRSMFQETILRNLPFCDEFLLIASRRYENIIKGQLRHFRQLNCRFVYEEDNAITGTALPVTLALLSCKKSESVLIVSADSVIEGDYNQTIINLQNIIHSGKIGVVGCKPNNKQSGYNFLDCKGDSILKFAKCNNDGTYLWDCGISGGTVENYLNCLDSDYLSKCIAKLNSYDGIINSQISQDFDRTSFSYILDNKQLTLVNATFDYNRIIDLRSYIDYKGKKEKNSYFLQTESNNVNVINTEDGKSIIVNDVSDLIVVNTVDALYISSDKNVANIKRILKEQHDNYPSLFDESRITYETWGYRETIYYTHGYRFLKEVIYEKNEIPFHCNLNHTTILNIAKGQALITVENEKTLYIEHQSLFIPVSTKYRIENAGDSDLILLVTRMGDGILNDEPIMSIEENLVKLRPFFKECIWGGEEIQLALNKDLKGKKKIGESWELSTHPAGESVIADGIFEGKTLQQFIDIVGKECLGWKAQAFNKFPLLIKFIDSHDKLSIQVHPDDEYAFLNENQYGKNEMWYIISAKPGAFIYAGFKRDVSREEVERRVKNNTLEEILNKIEVHAGETYFLRAGTIHAIGAGCLICEIQQNSNVTYRLYDYDRKDSNGNKRELHIGKALDVINYKSSIAEYQQNRRVEQFQTGKKELLGECKYFSAVKYEAHKNLTLSAEQGSFMSFVILSGEGVVESDDGISTKQFKKGDTFFGISTSYRFNSENGFSIIAVTL